MALGVASQQLDLLDPVSRFCEERLPTNSIFAFLAGHREVLFPDAMFTDLFAGKGRRSVPPSVVAAVMVLQRLEGLSETVRRSTGSASTSGGGMPPGWAAGTVRAGSRLRTPCWWTCAKGCAVRIARTASSR